MPAKTEMSAQEWFHHSLFAVVSVTMPRWRKDSPLNLPGGVHLGMAVNKRRDAMDLGVKVQLEIRFYMLAHVKQDPCVLL